MTDQAKAFAEDVALWFESLGVPRMAGRVLGWLLVCEPSHQSADQLAEALQASRGSISTATRSLITGELAERVTFPGDRRTYYRVRADWNSLLETQLKRIADLRRLTGDGLEALADTPSRCDRLEQIHEFASFWEHELGAVLSRRRADEA